MAEPAAARYASAGGRAACECTVLQVLVRPISVYPKRVVKGPLLRAAADGGDNPLVGVVERYSDEQLLSELRHVAATVPGALTKAVFDDQSRHAKSATIRRRFGGWRAALIAAGLEARSAHRTAAPRPGRMRGQWLSDELLIGELQKVAERVGSTTVTVAQVRAYSGVIGTQVLVSRFGSFGAACAAAGLHQSSKLNRWSDRDLATNFRRVERRLGRTPIRADMDRPPSIISSGCYVYRCGSWEASVATLTAARPRSGGSAGDTRAGSPDHASAGRGHL